MNTTSLIMLPVVILLLILVCGTARADQSEMLLAQSNLHMDYKAQKTGWPTLVFDQIKREFNVTEETIYALREKGLSYSDISAVLSLSEQMPGGVNRRNIDKVVRIRRGSEYAIGWGSIAQALDLKTTPAVEHAQTINQSSWTATAKSLPDNHLSSEKNSDWAIPALREQAPALEEGLRPTHKTPNIY